jgi:Gene 66 (IR5) protein
VSKHLDQIDELLRVASVLEPGPAKVAMVEEAVRLADAQGDLEEGFRTREELITAAMFAGQPDVELVAFSWCLSQCDREPEKFPENDMLWKYKWVLDSIGLFPQVTRRQIEDMLEDMSRRYHRAGSTMHAVHTLRRDLAMYMGDAKKAEEAHLEMERTRRDRLSNCAACVADGTVEYLAFLGRPGDALERAKPILAGHERCSEVPQRTYALVLLPMLRERRLTEAMSCHLKGYRLIARNPKFVNMVARHLTFLALTGNLPRAVRMLERHLPDALNTTGVLWQFDFYLSALVLFDRLREQGQTEIRLRLPTTLAGPIFGNTDARGRFVLAELSQWFQERSADLANRFDARNGNDHHQRRLAEVKELAKLAQPFAAPERKWNENIEE